MKKPEELGGIVAERAEAVTNLWQHRGLYCALLRPPFMTGRNGYVQVPLAARRNPIVEHAIKAPGGITWHDGVWVGFDIGHAGDVWLPDDPGEAESGFAWYLRQSGLPPINVPSEWTTVWTTEKLIEATNDVADQVIEVCELAGLQL